ncbi:MAG: PAS domain S-box protein [Myxococcota bacterium]|nr:PAS domain S-box protein [Myxococcota bacterium]
MPLYLSVVVPLTAVFVLAFFLQFRADVLAAQERLLTQESAVIGRGVRWVDRELEGATSDLRFVADLIGEAIEGESATGIEVLERSALAFMESRPGYFQVRFLDAVGLEVVKVERTRDGAGVAPASDLQNKSARAYFTETMRLRPGEVFLSRMELNAEHGKLEQPHKPVIRLAIPIDDASGQRRGVAILNAHGEHFLRAFERNGDEAGIQRMIVDSQGYWLQHRQAVEWGFVLDHGRSFSATFPQVWSRLEEGEPGDIEAPEGLFQVDRVTLQPAGQTTSESHAWLFISLIPRRILDDVAVHAATPLLVLAMPLYFVLLVVGWALAAAIQRRRLAQDALRGLEEVQRAMMRFALDAIVVMDGKGITLEFNPSAQEIFGYTRDEACGRLVADIIIPPAHREAHRIGMERYLATGEGTIIEKHIDELTAIRKNGEEFPVELTVCPIMVSGRHLFCGFLRDLSEKEDD